MEKCHTLAMPFPCPGCGADVGSDPEAWALRCPSCGAVLRCRAVDTDGADRAYDVEVVGRPDTRTRIAISWSQTETRRLGAWLLWSSIVTLALVGVLYGLARWLAPS